MVEHTTCDSDRDARSLKGTEIRRQDFPRWIARVGSSHEMGCARVEIGVNTLTFFERDGRVTTGGCSLAIRSNIGTTGRII